MHGTNAVVHKLDQTNNYWLVDNGLNNIYNYNNWTTKFTFTAKIYNTSATLTATDNAEYVTKYHLDNSVHNFWSDTNNVTYGDGTFGKVDNDVITDDTIDYHKLEFSGNPDSTTNFRLLSLQYTGSVHELIAYQPWYLVSTDTPVDNELVYWDATWVEHKYRMNAFVYDEIAFYNWGTSYYVTFYDTDPNWTYAPNVTYTSWLIYQWSTQYYAGVGWKDTYVLTNGAFGSSIIHWFWLSGTHKSYINWWGTITTVSTKEVKCNIDNISNDCCCRIKK